MVNIEVRHIKKQMFYLAGFARVFRTWSMTWKQKEVVQRLTKPAGCKHLI